MFNLRFLEYHRSGGKPVLIGSLEELKEYIKQKEGLLLVTNESLLEYLKKSELYIHNFALLEGMLTPYRYEHSLSVRDCANELALIHGIDPFKASIASVLHDCARCMKLEDMQKLAVENGLKLDEKIFARAELLHGYVGEKLAQKLFKVDDEEILSAIRKHTLGDEYMSDLDMLIFLADTIEPKRRAFEGVDELRRLAGISLIDACILCLKMTKDYVESQGLEFVSKNCYENLLKRRK